MAAKDIHPLARRALAELSMPEPVARFQTVRTQALLDLASNTNPYGGEWSDYPPPMPVELQAEYAEYLEQARRQHGDGAGPPLGHDNILITEGSIAGIDLIVRAFCEPNADPVCICNPTFLFYEHCARTYGLPLLDIPLIGSDLDRLDVDRIVASGAKALILCSPSNPLGCSIADEDVLAVLERFCGLVLIDEAYVEFSRRSSWVRLVDRYANLAVLRTFSKAWGLAGVRCGAVIAAPLVLATLRLLQLTFCISSPAQQLTRERLRQRATLVPQVQAICAERERLRSRLEGLPIVRRIYPSDANFLGVFVQDPQRVAAHLQSRGIHIHRAPRLPGLLRIAVGLPTDNDRVVAALQQL